VVLRVEYVQFSKQNQNRFQNTFRKLKRLHLEWKFCQCSWGGSQPFRCFASLNMFIKRFRIPCSKLVSKTKNLLSKHQNIGSGLTQFRENYRLNGSKFQMLKGVKALTRSFFKPAPKVLCRPPDRHDPWTLFRIITCGYKHTRGSKHANNVTEKVGKQFIILVIASKDLLGVSLRICRKSKYTDQLNHRPVKPRSLLRVDSGNCYYFSFSTFCCIWHFLPLLWWEQTVLQDHKRRPRW